MFVECQDIEYIVSTWSDSHSQNKDCWTQPHTISSVIDRVSAKDTIVQRLKSFRNQLHASSVLDVETLEQTLEEVRRLIAEHGEEGTFDFVMLTLAEKLSDMKKEIAHEDEISQLESERLLLELKVTSINIPVFKNPGERFDELRLEAALLEIRISDHKDECYAVRNLKQAIVDVKEKIEYLDTDNKSAIGWLTASSVLTGASIGVAFIPLVGLPISAALMAVPYLCKLGHRLGVSYKRKKRFAN